MHVISIGRCADCTRRATLIDARCGCCDDMLAPAPAPRPLAVSRALGLLLAELVAEEIAAPLAQRLTLASVAADLCRLAGERIPDAVADAPDGPGHAPHPPREPHREPAHTAA